MRIALLKVEKFGICNETIRDMTGVEKIEGFLRDEKFGWFELMEWMEDERALVKANNFVVDGSKKVRSKWR